MITGQPSRTLLTPAIARAAHQLLDAPLILDDPIAVGLMPEASREAILGSSDIHRTQAARAARALFVLRSRFTEDRLESAVSRGVRQYVMLGAGMETFPWRQPAFAEGLRIFFSDHPASLAWARERFRDRKLSIPPNLTFVAADLEEQRIGQQLSDSGFDMHIPSLVSMLGVFQYLTPQAVDSMLRFFASLPSGSELVFSFIVTENELSDFDAVAIRASTERGRKIGEPWLSRVPSADMLARIQLLGFGNTFHLSPQLAQQRYFAGRSDGLVAPRREQLLSITSSQAGSVKQA